MQPIVLDIRTLSFVTTSIASLFAVGLFAFGWLQEKFRGFKLLAAASALHGAGVFLIGYRDLLPDAITIVLANMMVITGLVCYYEGTRRFLRGATAIHPASFAAFVAGLGLFLYFTYQVPSVNSRIIGVAAIYAIISALCVRELARDLPDYWRVPGTLTAFVFGGYTLFQVYRVFWTLGESTIQSFMAAGTVHAFAFIFVILLVIGSAFGYIWMVSKRLEFELTELATYDQLTNVLNRRGVDILASQEFSKMARIEGEMAIILTDIDHFKQLNDRYGHNVGDEVLVAFAALLRDHLRPFDIFGRVGGEEFVVLMPNATLNQATILAERLRRLVEEFIIEVDEHRLQITASFGVAPYLPQANTLAQLLPYADKALYQSKQGGRNVVTAFSPEDQLPQENPA